MYKVGDKVRIKSIDWYNKNKDEDGDVELSTHIFVPEMSEYCGAVVTIKDVFEDIDDNVVYYMEDIVWDWTNEMIECLVERNGKTYPYKIGDRVVLKGNNRCATITDLKYNSWGNLSYYVKIDNDKDISIDYPTDLLLPYDNKIKGFLEDETIPKFKVGDKITNGNVTLTISSLLSDRYIVEDTFGKCGTLYFNSQDEWKIVGEEPIDCKKCGLTRMSTRCLFMDNCPHNQPKNTIEIPKDWILKDENGNIINTTKIVLEKKKKEYPKTYEECCKVLGCKADDFFTDFSYNNRDVEISDYEDKIDDLLQNLRKLRYCRDAYWKIAGEEMGLGKPWEPDWSIENDIKYVIEVYRNNVRTNSQGYSNTILAFPTPEMRDTFYENFKKEIEICKEFL